jgi:hypothetical protein
MAKGSNLLLGLLLAFTATSSNQSSLVMMTPHHTYWYTAEEGKSECSREEDPRGTECAKHMHQLRIITGLGFAKFASRDTLMTGGPANLRA